MENGFAGRDLALRSCDSTHWLTGNVSFVQEIRGKMPDFQKLATTSNEEPSASCHCERSACPACHERSVVERSAGKAISLQIGGLLTLRVRFAVAAGACRERSVTGGSQWQG